MSGSLDANAIRALFERISPQFEYPLKSVTFPPGLEPSESESRKLVQTFVDRIEAVIDSKPTFAARFDYGWATDPDVYASEWEALLQSVLVTTLSEMGPSDPLFDGLALDGHRPIVVKEVSSPRFSSMSVPGRDADFILLSYGFQKFVQLLLGTLFDFRDASAALNDGPARWCTINYFFGQDVERVLRGDPEQADAILGHLIEQSTRAWEGEHFEHREPVSPRLTEASTNILMRTAYLNCEAFFVFHEMAHLLGDDAITVEREGLKEYRADGRALCMMTVANSVIEEMIVGLMSGPIVFFQASRLYELVRRLADASEGQRDKSLLFGPEVELATRLMAVQGFMEKVLCLPPEGVVTIAKDILDEFNMLTIGCQAFLLRRMGKSVELDDLLFSREGDRGGNRPVNPF